MIYICKKQCDNSQIGDSISTRNEDKIHWYNLHPDYWEPASGNFKVLEFDAGSTGIYKLVGNDTYKLYKRYTDELHPSYSERVFRLNEISSNYVLKLQFDDGTILTSASKVKYRGFSRTYSINELCINDWHMSIECRVVDMGWTLLSTEIARGKIEIVKEDV